MRRVVLIFLCIGVFVMGYMVYDVMYDNKQINNKISVLNDTIMSNENDKELYNAKQKELEDIKEKNKDKVSKYDEVDAWNQEIIKYLD